MKSTFAIIAMAALLYSPLSAQQALPPYKNPSVPVEDRVKDLLSRMTPTEKFWQLFMIYGRPDQDTARYEQGIFGIKVNPDASDAATQIVSQKPTDDLRASAIKNNVVQHYFVNRTRLGIPAILFGEVLHGVIAKDATVFPQAIGLAASFDTTMMRQVASAIAEESQLRGFRQVLSPVVNLATDVRWGRTEETYGEDPWLSSEMGVAFVSEFERRGIITTPKHFAVNHGDGGRDSYPIHIDDYGLNDLYLRPFKACIERGGSRSVMSAYNSLNGIACSGQPHLLNEILKKDWGFRGFVISDAGATGGANVLHYTSPDYPTSGKQSVMGGLDVIFQTSFDHYTLFQPPFLDGSMDSNRINDAVARVLRAKFTTGLFDHPYIPVPDTLIPRKALARKAAQEAIVLLKNDNHTLPIAREVKSIAIIGVDATEARMGGYSGPGNTKINIKQGIQARAGRRVSIQYAPGCGRTSPEWLIVPSTCLSTADHNEGLTAEYFPNITLHGKPSATKTEKQIDFQWTLFPPDPSLPADFYSARLTGFITAPQSGRFQIGLDGNDGYRLFINNQLIVDRWAKQTYSTTLAAFDFEKDKAYPLRIEFNEPNGNAHLKLIWNIGIVNDWQQRIQEAVAIAKESDIAIVTAGIEEGEFQDRSSLQLPGHQEEMIKAIAALGKPMAVVLVGGSAITMSNWLDKVPAVVDVWYPGEEGGNALADVLFGDYNPAGRLPITFPASVGQVPLSYLHQPTGRGDDYIDGSGLPLFPFGYGLSYSQFAYSDLKIDKTLLQGNETAILTCKVKNESDRDGDEVVQWYTHKMISATVQPTIQLAGCQRIHLKAGEQKKVQFTVTTKDLYLWNKPAISTPETSTWRMMIGASSRDLRLKLDLKVKTDK